MAQLETSAAAMQGGSRAWGIMGEKRMGFLNALGTLKEVPRGSHNVACLHWGEGAGSRGAATLAAQVAAPAPPFVKSWICTWP